MIDFATLTRPKSPNTYLVAPEGLCRATTPDQIAPVFAVSPDSLRDAFLRLMRGLPRVSDGPANMDPLAYDFIETTPLMRFKDDISVRFLPAAGGGATLALYSRSRVGYSDLGANKARVERYLSMLAASVASASRPVGS